MFKKLTIFLTAGLLRFINGMSMPDQRKYLAILERVNALPTELEKLRNGTSLETPMKQMGQWLQGAWFQRGYKENNNFIRALRDATRIEIHVWQSTGTYWNVTIACYCACNQRKWKHQVYCHLHCTTGNLTAKSEKVEETST